MQQRGRSSTRRRSRIRSILKNTRDRQWGRWTRFVDYDFHGIDKRRRRKPSRMINSENTLAHIFHGTPLISVVEQISTKKNIPSVSSIVEENDTPPEPSSPGLSVRKFTQYFQNKGRREVLEASTSIVKRSIFSRESSTPKKQPGEKVQTVPSRSVKKKTDQPDSQKKKRVEKGIHKTQMAVLKDITNKPKDATGENNRQKKRKKEPVKRKEKGPDFKKRKKRKSILHIDTYSDNQEEDPDYIPGH